MVELALAYVSINKLFDPVKTGFFKSSKLSSLCHICFLYCRYREDFHMEVLRIEHLTKIYGKGENEVKALDNVSFMIEQGEFVAIIGPSGSGKSTLLHML